MPARIGPRRQRKLFIAEWREARGLTQDTLAKRLGTSSMTVSRWERGQSLVNTDVMDALAEALAIEPEDLWHHPDRPSPNALLRDQAPDIQEQAINIIRAIRRAR